MIIGKPTALLVVSLFNVEIINANAGPKRGPAYLARILALTGKVRVPYCQRGVEQRSARQHVDRMMSAENRELRQAR